MEGICQHCGQPIEFELTDVGIGILIPHGWCKNENCSTYGWATTNIDYDKEYYNDEENDDDLFCDDIEFDCE